MKKKKKSTRILDNKLLFEEDGNDASFCGTCMSVLCTMLLLHRFYFIFYFLFYFFFSVRHFLSRIFSFDFKLKAINLRWMQKLWYAFQLDAMQRMVAVIVFCRLKIFSSFSLVLCTRWAGRFFPLFERNVCAGAWASFSHRSHAT